MAQKLPRATGTEPVAITPRLWNQLADMVEQAVMITGAGDVDIIDMGIGGKIIVPRTRRGLIHVLLTKNGGVNGTDKTTACTNTFDIYDAERDPSKSHKLNTAGSGAALGPVIAPFRALKIELTTAAEGIAKATAGGTYKLLITDEKPVNEKDCA
jgi:hypothetical protein